MYSSSSEGVANRSALLSKVLATRKLAHKESKRERERIAYAMRFIKKSRRSSANMRETPGLAKKCCGMEMADWLVTI
jgi:hypothetical protein